MITLRAFPPFFSSVAVRVGLLGGVLASIGFVDAAAAQDSAAPVLFHTDLTSGPKTSGENNNGVFVTIYGKRFGSSRGSSTVTFGGGEVASYRLWSDNRITVQLGSSAATGNIVVNVGGVASNTLSFTVRSGNIYFVSTTGNNGNDGSFSSPWATMVKAKNTMVAGDTTYVMNGVTETAQDPGWSGAYSAVLVLEGTGTSSNPVALVAYPGATVTIGSSTGRRRGIRVIPDPAEDPDWWIVSGGGGTLNLRAVEEAVEIIEVPNFRLVGADISCPEGNAASGCITAYTAPVDNTKILSNYVHDTGKSPASSKLYHAIYIADEADHTEIGWNTLANNRTCYTIQFLSSSLPPLTNISVHDNLIHHDNCAAINFASVDPSRGKVEAYNNVMYDLGNAATPPNGMGANGCVYAPGYAEAGPAPSGAIEVFNNTCYNVGSNGAASSGQGAYFRDTSNSPGLFLNLRNNVTVLVSGQNYYAPDSGNGNITGSNNLWFGRGNGPSGLTGNINADPKFVDVASRNLRLLSGSPGIDAGVNTALTRDFDGDPRSVIDVGAFEYVGSGPPPLPSLSIGDATVTEGNSGTVTAQFTVSLSTGSSQTVTVNYATANGTAQAGSDYVAASGSVTFSPGSVQRTINVTVNGDTVVEPNETFSVNLSAPTNATLADGQGVGTITNDDTASLPTLSINDVTVTEGNSGTVTAQFTVSLSAPSTQTVSVNYATANGTAQAGSDYVAASGSATFSPGSVQQAINVTVNGDTVVEPNETFSVNLSAPTNATLADGQGVGTITNDDTASLPTLSINDVTVTEGNSGTVTAQFTVSLSAPSTQTVSVNYATANGTAQAGSDYVAASGSATFSPGSVQQAINVTVNGDTVVEPNETFSVNLSAPTNATLADGQGVGTITNDDTASLPTLSINDVTVTEGNSGTVTAQFTVSLSAPSTQTVSVNYATANGTAQAGSDYVAASGSVTFSPGSVQQAINVTVNGDTVVEPNETFSVNLSAPTNATLADGQGVGTITNDDTASLPTLSINDVTVTEGNSGTVTAQFTVSLSAPSTQTVSVNYATANGTAQAGSDYVAASGSVTLSPGSVQQAINVTVNGDTVVEPNETFSVNLSAPTNATLADGQGMGTINDDDTVQPLNEPVAWTNAGGVTVSGNNLTKNTSIGWGNSGAASNKILASGDGYVEFTAQEADSYRMLGLSNGDSDYNWDDIDFSLYPMGDGTLRVYEKGILRGTYGSYASGDKLRVAVTGGVVRYYRDGTLLYTSPLAPTFPLLVDTALYSTGATLVGAVISGSWTAANNEPVVWASPVGVLVSGNNLTKTAASGWGNAGAASRKFLAAGDGYVEHTIQETNTYRMLGLSNGNANNNWDDIDFSLYPMADGTLRVYEKGTLRGSFGSYASGDKLRIAVVGNVVHYYRNGTLLYSSPMAPTYPLIVDTALYDTGATLVAVVISRNWTEPNNEPVVWASAVGVAVSGNNLTKNVGTGWGNAGAVSTKSLMGGIGYVEHTIQETNTYRMLGLSNGNSNNNWDDIDFSFYPMADGTLAVYEKGTFRGTFGSYASGDTLRIAVVGNVVHYYRNGTLLYSSPTAPTFPLLVDTALYDTGATLGNVMISKTFQ